MFENHIGTSHVCVQSNIVTGNTCKMVLYVYVFTDLSHKTYKWYTYNSSHILKHMEIMYLSK
jgi:hypothetical protein